MEFYHLLNRGVDKRDIFLDSGDHARFVRDLYTFNDTIPAPDAYRTPKWDIVSPTFRSRERLVDIHAWVLMKNHYHLLVSERIDGGITQFLKKVNIGYAKYFNERYERSGTLFQGRTKKILIQSDAHFLHMVHYIHLNPLDFLKNAEKWRTGSIRSTREAMDHLHAYRWSSYLDYCGIRNIPSLITTEVFREIIPDMERATFEYLKDRELPAGKPIWLE